MLLNKQKKEAQLAYNHKLQVAGSLSRLFSDSDVPFIVSRNIENAYCEAFLAENLGRADCSADAALGDFGVGLKTFLHGNGRTLQKIAEFNKESNLYRNQEPKELITTVAKLRNERIKFTLRTYGLEQMIYHVVTRKPNELLIFESPMDLINIERITNVKMSNKNTITFNDDKNEYSFNLTKSTLFKRFYTEEEDALEKVAINILEDPYSALQSIILSDNFKENLAANNHSEKIQVADSLNKVSEVKEKTYETDPYVILPFYSDRGNKRHVPEKSGLNQWNAGGRARHPDEVYIPIPKQIHNVFPDFFPNRDVKFNLRLPDDKVLSSKVCQDASKALMSNPNKELGKWMLRTVLELEERELLTYEKLQVLGFDSVKVTKHSSNYYSIDFCETGSFDEFQTEYL